MNKESNNKCRNRISYIIIACDCNDSLVAFIGIQYINKMTAIRYIQWMNTMRMSIKTRLCENNLNYDTKMIYLTCIVNTIMSFVTFSILFIIRNEIVVFPILSKTCQQQQIRYIIIHDYITSSVGKWHKLKIANEPLFCILTCFQVILFLMILVLFLACNNSLVTGFIVFNI